MGLYIEHPLTFVSLYFMERMFKNQQIDTILTFMTQFTKRWILDEKATFDFNFYLMLFLKKCVRRDTIQVIGTYVKSLEVPELLKINEVIFKLSFEEDKKKYGIPESIDWDIQLAHLTSAGFADKFLLVNKIFPCFS